MVFEQLSLLLIWTARAFLKLVVVNNLEMYEKGFAEVASATTVIHFNTHIATHRHTLTDIMGGVSVTFVPCSFMLQYNPRAMSHPSPLTHDPGATSRTGHGPRLTSALCSQMSGRPHILSKCEEFHNSNSTGCKKTKQKEVGNSSVLFNFFFHGKVHYPN